MRVAVPSGTVTDEMRMALTAVAVARGLAPVEAWDLIGRLRVDGRDLRDVLEELNTATVDELYQGGFASS